MIEFLKTNAVLLALVAVILYQQSELKEVERTLNYIYAAVQTNNNDIQDDQRRGVICPHFLGSFMLSGGE